MPPKGAPSKAPPGKGTAPPGKAAPKAGAAKAAPKAAPKASAKAAAKSGAASSQGSVSARGAKASPKKPGKAPKERRSARSQSPSTKAPEEPPRAPEPMDESAVRLRGYVALRRVFPAVPAQQLVSALATSDSAPAERRAALASRVLLRQVVVSSPVQRTATLQPGSWRTPTGLLVTAPAPPATVVVKPAPLPASAPPPQTVVVSPQPLASAPLPQAAAAAAPRQIVVSARLSEGGRPAVPPKVLLRRATVTLGGPAADVGAAVAPAASERLAGEAGAAQRDSGEQPTPSLSASARGAPRRASGGGARPGGGVRPMARSNSCPNAFAPPPRARSPKAQVRPQRPSAPAGPPKEGVAAKKRASAPPPHATDDDDGGDGADLVDDDGSLVGQRERGHRRRMAQERTERQFTPPKNRIRTAPQLLRQRVLRADEVNAVQLAQQRAVVLEQQDASGPAVAAARPGRAGAEASKRQRPSQAAPSAATEPQRAGANQVIIPATGEKVFVPPEAIEGRDAWNAIRTKRVVVKKQQDRRIAEGRAAKESLRDAPEA